MSDFARDLKLLPNVISLFRIVVIFAAAGIFLAGFRMAGLLVAIPAGLSDYLDGYIARKRGQSTELGALLDGLADILFHLVCLTVGAHYGVWPSYLIIAWGTRDMGVTMMRASAGQQGFFIRSSFLAKAAVNFNYYAFILMALDIARPFSSATVVNVVHWSGLGIIHFGLLLQWISGLMYLGQYARQYHGKTR
jgi:cardiolipin synthase